jgi:hypothetical protein
MPIHTYEPFEKKQKSTLVLDMYQKRLPGDFDAIVSGFAPGSAKIETPASEARLILKQLLKEVSKRVVIAPGTYRMGYRDVRIYGCTDRVGGSKNYNDEPSERPRRIFCEIFATVGT